jgi:hypothetical protein
MDRHTGANAVPDPVDVDVGQKTAMVVEEALPPDRVRARGYGRFESELTQSTSCWSPASAASDDSSTSPPAA